MNCLITGGTKGIGRAVAEIFAKNGFNLAIAARSSDDLNKVKKEIEERYAVEVLTFPTDLSHKTEVERLADLIPTHWDCVDVLVNNAGVFVQGPMLEEPDDQLERMMNVNLFSAYHLTRSLLPFMLERKKGHIFNVCSVASQQAYPECSSYTITKFALLGFSKSLRLEFRNKGIKVTSVIPGSTLTASWEGADIPPERLIHPDEVAKSIWCAWDMGPTAVVEEIVMRPQLGDL